MSKYANPIRIKTATFNLLRAIREPLAIAKQMNLTSDDQVIRVLIDESMERNVIQLEPDFDPESA